MFGEVLEAKRLMVKKERSAARRNSKLELQQSAAAGKGPAGAAEDHLTK